MSPYEQIARSRKVGKLLYALPYGRTEAEVNEIADKLAAYPQSDRNVFARSAGCARPSEETWRQFVKAARERIPAWDLLDDDGPEAA